MKVKYVKITAGMLTGLAVASTAPYGVQAAGLTAGVASYTNNVVASASAPTAGVTSAVADVMLKGDETTTTDTDVASNEAETVKSAYADVAIAKVQDYVTSEQRIMRIVKSWENFTITQQQQFLKQQMTDGIKFHQDQLQDM